MADQVDVEQAFAETIAALLYPNGATLPSAINTPGKNGNPQITAAPAQIYRGWPKGADIDAAMDAGVTVVSIYPRGDTERNTTRYDPQWQTRDPPVHTLAIAVDLQGSRITLSGTVRSDPAQFVTVLVGIASAYSYAVQPSDTLATIMAAMASLIRADYPGTSSSGPVITVIGGEASAKIGSTGTSWREVGRQSQWFQIVVWAPSDEHRTAVIRLIDGPLRDIRRLLLADGSLAGITFVRTIVEDKVEKEQVFRRDLIFDADYPTSITADHYEITTQRGIIAVSTVPNSNRVSQI